jgi:hypothetical protein
MLLSDLLNRNLDNIATSEALCSTACPTCGAQQTLAKAAIDQSDDLETIYTCLEGCGRILVVSARTEPEAPLQKGYRMGLWMIRNPKDLFVQPSAFVQRAIMFPACADALMD